MPAESQLAALVALIADATKTVEALYQKSSKPYVPSLDDTEPHPLDTAISSPEMREAVRVIEGACAQLCATVGRPNHVMVNKLWDMQESACLRVAVLNKIPDILQDKPAGVHVSEIAQKTGINAGKLSRVLQLLATKHCFKEVATDVFANNRLSQRLLSTSDLSSFALHLSDETYGATSVLHETLEDPEWTNSTLPEHSPFNKWSKYPRPLFSYYEGDTPEGGRRGARFAHAMIGFNETTQGNSVVQYFPWGELGDGATVCDLGGGIGNIAMQLAKAYPNLKLKLQDTPQRVEQAKTEFWPANCPEAIAEDRIEFKAVDFLTESPIKDCTIYYLKNIMHDWPDKECINILSGIRNVMGPNSRVLLQDYVLQRGTRGSDQAETRQAPQPLLPNYGVGAIRQFYVDVDMMVMVNCRERYLDEFVKLGKEVGLEFVKLWEFGEMGGVELRLGDATTASKD